MFSLKHLALASGLGLAALTGAAPALAQTTDGFHAIQIFPVVVDSASFTQRFTFKNPDAAKAALITASFFPADGTPVSCPDFTIPAGGLKVFASLREACPATLAGSQFGYLYTYTASGAAVPAALPERQRAHPGRHHPLQRGRPVLTGRSANAVTQDAPTRGRLCVGNAET